MVIRNGSVNFGGVSGRPFSPIDRPNLGAWLDATDNITVKEVSDSVYQWDDKSGNNNHAIQGTGADQPTTNATTLNGLNVIDWVLDFMNFTSSIDHSNGYTVFVVTDNIVNDANNKTFITGATGSFSARFDSGERLDLVKTATAVLINGVVSFVAGANIASMKTSSAGNAGYKNGVLDVSNATDSALTQPLTNVGGITGKYNGSIGELVIYTRVLTDAEHNLIGNYLANKWGLIWTDI